MSCEECCFDTDAECSTNAVGCALGSLLKSPSERDTVGYGASEVSAVFRRLTEISEYEQHVVTRLRGSYLSNHLIDLHAVIFVG